MAMFDADAFARDVRAARDETRPSDTEDAAHLAGIERWTVLLGVVGLALAARGVVSPLGMLAFGYYKYGKFAVLAHHSLHGGWGKERRGWYAVGIYRRVIDWLDWISPMAWVMEHNKIHHYRLNEDADPDFVERNTEVIHSWNLPLFVKYTIVGVQAATWKWFYYASNTLKLCYANHPRAPPKSEVDQPITIDWLVAGALGGDPWYRAIAVDCIFNVMAPPLVLQFLVPPLLAGLLLRGGTCGPFCWRTLLNLVGAEVVTNVHAFCTIVTNHAGADLWWFDGPCQADTAEFYLRAVLGSTAYPAGTDLLDYWHGYLNYQGEHHAFPDLSPLHYQRLHPRFKEACAAHGVPYVQEPVWRRAAKTADVIVGVAKHKRLHGLAVDQPQLWSVRREEGEGDRPGAGGHQRR